jgi:hypothetical protein
VTDKETGKHEDSGNPVLTWVSSSSEYGHSLEMHMSDDRQFLASLFGNDPKVHVYNDDLEVLRDWAEGTMPVDWEGLNLDDVCISVADLPDTVYDFREGRWIKRSSDGITLLFHIDTRNDGVVYELAYSLRNKKENRVKDSSWNLRQLFVADGFADFREYIELLRLDPSRQVPTLLLGEGPLSSVITQIYLPFYRSPSEFRTVRENPSDWDFTVPTWVSLERLCSLLLQHRSEKDEWLNAVVRQANSHCGPTSDRMVPFQDCEKARAQLRETDYISPVTRAGFVVVRAKVEPPAMSVSHPSLCRRIGFGFMDGYLPILCEVSPKHSAAYVAALLNSAEGPRLLQPITQCAQTASLGPLDKATVSLPCRRDQLHCWTRSVLERESLKRFCANTPGKIIAIEHQMNPEQHVEYVRLGRRFLGMTSQFDLQIQKEVEAVLAPLPFLLEYPILAWRRASDKMLYRNAMALFLH